ncbi:MAG: hypothetical protein QME64_06655, partial [bacterium]|nr:hypothetical protein [bacterium]
KTGKKAIYTIIPMLFMLIMCCWSLITMAIPFFKSLPQLLQGVSVKSDIVIAGICSIILLVLSILLVFEAIQTLKVKRVRGSYAKPVS